MGWWAGDESREVERFGGGEVDGSRVEPVASTFPSLSSPTMASKASSSRKSSIFAVSYCCCLKLVDGVDCGEYCDYNVVVLEKAIAKIDLLSAKVWKARDALQESKASCDC